MAGIRIDAGMPMHGHGMNYQPEKKVLVDGGAVLAGFAFHMPGQWRLRFTLRDGERTAVFEAHYELTP